MKGGFLTHCGLASLLAAQAIGLALPTVAGAQNPPPISAEVQKHLLHEPGVPLLGSTAADITIVEYFDYNCPFCKELAPAFHPFIEHDHAAAVLYKEWPIFGGVSIYAAQSALAATYQSKYLQAHDALISAPRLAEETQVDAALRGAGIDMDRLKKDLAAHGASINALLMRNDAEARGLGMRGTPGVLIGRQRVSNLSDLAGLQAAVAASRRAGT
jgi:protein-disulfide isomerase